MIRRVGAALAAMVAMVGMSPTGAQAAPMKAAPTAVTCGSYLEADAYLTKDLRCPNGVGVYLALDVTLDLRGHKIIGPGASSTTGPGIGVSLAPVYYSHVINGTITGWPTAIGGNEDFETVESADLRNLKLIGNGTAVQANQAQLTIANSVFRNNKVGVESLSYGEVGTSVTITGSTFRGNGVGVHADPVGEPVPGYSTVLTGNTFTKNGDGIYLDIPGTTLKRNTAVHNTGWGIYAPGATDLGGNVARHNGKSPQCVGVTCRAFAAPRT